MRSLKTVVLRRTCAMFRNHHRLLPMELLSVIIIFITVFIDNQVEAIEHTNSLPLSSPLFSTVFTSNNYDSEVHLNEMQVRHNNANNYHHILQRSRIDSQKALQHPPVPSAATITSQQQQQPLLTNSLSQSNNNNQSNFSLFTNRQDCNGSDCLRNNDAISLYIPYDDNGTNDALRPALLLLSNNNPSTNNERKFWNSPYGAAFKLSKLHTGMRVLRPNGQQTQKSSSSPYTSYHISQGNSRNPREYGDAKGNSRSPGEYGDAKGNSRSPGEYGDAKGNSRSPSEYGGGRQSEIKLMPPPFAGGAELTDFIQPIDATFQNHHVYDNIIPNHITTTSAYYGQKEYSMLAAHYINNGNDYQSSSSSSIPLSSKLATYETATVLSQPPVLYPAFSPQTIDYHRTALPNYGTQYDDLHSSTTTSDETLYAKIIENARSDELINSMNIKADVYPPAYQYTTVHNYPESQLTVTNLGPAPPAAMPVDIYSNEQQAFIPDTTDQQSEILIPCTDITTTTAATNDEANHEANVESPYGFPSETITTTTMATTNIPLCVKQLSKENEQTFPASSTPLVDFGAYATVDRTETGPESSITNVGTPESDQATTTSAKLDLGKNQISIDAGKAIPSTASQTTSFPQATTPTTTTAATTTPTTATAATTTTTTTETTTTTAETTTTTAATTAETTTTTAAETAETTTAIVPDNEAVEMKIDENAITTSGKPQESVEPLTYDGTGRAPNISTATTPTAIVPNRLRGKARPICMEDGLQFEMNTLFPFTGQIFARNRKSLPECSFMFREANIIRVTMPYALCGTRNNEQQRPETQYHMEIIVIFQQKDNTNTMQSFLTQCVHQKVQYQKQVIPKRIEEALEELRLIPVKLEDKAQVPECSMRIVTEDEHGHGHDDDNDDEEVEVVKLGQPMKIEWSLSPESDAYGFHVRNCTVRDTVSNAEYLVIDERGCSTDINIFSHPHYDTYHDKAFVHWHAFKVPDINQLSIKCSIEICIDIPDTVSGLTNCDIIPSPPFCPDLITSPINFLLNDPEAKFVRKRREHKSIQQHVHADICFGDKSDEYCNSRSRTIHNHLHERNAKIPTSKKYCLSRLWLIIWTSLSALTTLLSIGTYGYCRYIAWQQQRRQQCFGLIKLATNSKITTATEVIATAKQQQQ